MQHHSSLALSLRVRVRAIILVAALIAVSCASPEGRRVAFNTVPEAGATTPTSVVTEPLDTPYVFACESGEVSGDACVSDLALPPLDDTAYDTVDEFIGSPAAQYYAVSLRNQLLFAAGCTELALPAGSEVLDLDTQVLMTQVVPEELQVQLVTLGLALTSATRVCRLPRAYSEDLGVAYEAGAAVLEILGAGDAPAAPTSGATPVEGQQRATELYVRLRDALLGDVDAPATNLWYSASHLSHITRLRALANEGERPQVLIVGGSPAATGINTITLTEQTQRNVFNVAMIDADPGASFGLADFVIAEFGAPLAMAIEVPVHQLVGDCDPRGLRGDEHWQQILELQSSTFEASTAAPLDRLLPAVDTQPYPGSRLAAEIGEVHGFFVQGTAAPLSGRADAAVIQGQLEASAAALGDAPCQPEIDRLIAAVNGYLDQGIKVLLFVPAISPQLDIGDFRAANAAVVSQVSSALPSVRLLQLGEDVNDNQLFDAFQVNEIGRDIATPRFRDELRLLIDG